MKSKFSEQELKERTLDLLYGLLEEDEAEELRRFIASDATAARVFDEARETVDRFARAARWEEAPEAEEDETAAKNVAVESAPFDGGASLLFGSAWGGDAFSATVDAETPESEETGALETNGESSGSNRKRAKRRLNLLRKLKSTAENERSGNDVNVGDRGGLGKERRRKKSGKAANLTEPSRPAAASRRFEKAKTKAKAEASVDGASGWATVGRTSSGDVERRSAARRFWARVPKPTLFQNLIIALAVVALSTAVGFWAQETALQARFRDDFRIQIAAPRTLARGESQTIAATTTAPNGKPRRVPIRFSFSDAETGAPLLAHTESGDASGVARFKIPDVADFPTRTLLTISAGEREKETFETILTVVDAPKTNVDANASARFAASEAVGKNALKVVAKKTRSRDEASAGKTAPTMQVAPLTAENERAQEEETGGRRPKNPKAEILPSPAAFDRSAATSAAPAPAFDGGMGMGAMGGTTSAAPTPAFDGGMGTGAMGGTTSAAPAPAFDGGMGMGAMGGTTSAAPAPASGGGMGTGAMGGTTSAAPAFNFASSGEKAPPATSPTSGTTEGTDAAKEDSVETFAAVVEDAPSDDFGRAVAEFESALSNDGESLDLERGAEGQFEFDATLGAPKKRRLDVRFYPNGGRLVAGRENVVWFECVDDAGRPVAGEFALNDSGGRVATAKTSEGGVGSLRWTPDAEETYSLETSFDGEIAKIAKNAKNVEIDQSSKVAEVGKDGKRGRTGEIGKAGKDGVDGGDDQEKGAAEEPASAEIALTDADEGVPTAPTFETFRFPAPTANVERVAFDVPTRVLESEKSVELEIWAENEIPLAATVEKNGVALAQRVWTASKGRRRVVVPLDSNVVGALNVSLWNCARTPFEKIGSAAVYRKPAVSTTLAATLERNDAGERALRVAVVEPKKGFANAESVRLDAFWAPTLDAALGALELDETLLYASDERRVETLATLALPPSTEPILFDNLLEMKESALKKLNAFWLGEAGLAGRVVGFGFVGCAALALLTIFCVLFGALKARRGAVVVLFCAALATFFYFERRRIDFSETLTEAIAVSVDESKAAQRDVRDFAAFPNVSNVPNGDAEEEPSSDANFPATVPLGTNVATNPTGAVEWSVPLTGPPANAEVGVILTKMVASDGTRAWKAIPLAELDGVEENADR